MNKHRNLHVKRMFSGFLAAVLLVSNVSIYDVAAESVSDESIVFEAETSSNIETINEDNTISVESVGSTDGIEIASDTGTDGVSVETDDTGSSNGIEVSSKTGTEAPVNAIETGDENSSSITIESETSREQETEMPEEIMTEAEYMFSGSSDDYTEEMSGMDFSTGRLIVGCEPDVIVDTEHIVSMYNGVYLMQYSSAEQAALAYLYYDKCADIVSPDAIVEVQTDEQSVSVDTSSDESSVSTDDGIVLSEETPVLEDYITDDNANPLQELENQIDNDESTGVVSNDEPVVQVSYLDIINHFRESVISSENVDETNSETVNADDSEIVVEDVVTEEINDAAEGITIASDNDPAEEIIEVESSESESEAVATDDTNEDTSLTAEPSILPIDEFRNKPVRKKKHEDYQYSASLSEEDVVGDNSDEIGDEADVSTIVPFVNQPPLIALIDTGASDCNNVIDRVSMLGDDVSDDNGHGDLMVHYIIDEYPDAQILSIKALDKDGKGGIASVYAAVEYAIARHANIINLSLSAYSTEENSILQDVINRATDAGIAVIGAAGNDGKNVKYFVPGNIDSAIIVGACDATGKRLDNSNRGKTIDYYVVSESTSEATARLSGILGEYAVNGSYNGITHVYYFEDDDSVLIEAVLNGDGMFHAAAAPSAIRKSVAYVNYWGPNESSFWSLLDWAKNYDDYLAALHAGDNRTWDSEKNALTSWIKPVADFVAAYEEGPAATQYTSTTTIGDYRYYYFTLLTLPGTAAQFGITGNRWYAGDAAGAAPVEFYKSATANTTNGTLKVGNNASNWSSATTRTKGQTVSSGEKYMTRHTHAFDQLDVNVSFEYAIAQLTYAFNSNGGTGTAIPNRTRYYTLAIKMPTNNFTKAGTNQSYTVRYSANLTGASTGASSNSFTVHNIITHTANGWNTNAAGTGTHLNNGAWIPEGTGSTTYYAEWRTTTDDTRKITLPTPTGPTGYTFDGWYTAATGGTKVGNAGAEYTVTSNLDLYAHWTPYPYKVRFNANGGAGSMSDQNMTYNTRTTLNANAFTKAGYVFAGWATSAENAAAGKRAYKDGQSVRNLTNQKNAVVNLYAIWVKMPTGTFVDAKTSMLFEGDINLDTKGKYRFIESKSAPGYIRDDTERDVDLSTAEPDSTVEVEFTNVPNKYAIHKVDILGHGIEANAKFRVWREGAEGTADDFTVDTTLFADPQNPSDSRTGQPGWIVLSTLAPGLWHYQEIQAPAPYTVNPMTFSFRVDENGFIPGARDNHGVLIEHQVRDTEQPVDYSIFKYDDKGNPLSGVTFTFNRAVKNLQTGTTGTTHTTDASGLIVIDITGLPNGSVEFWESSVPTGYLLDSTHHSFTIASGRVTGDRFIDIVNHTNSFRLRKVDDAGNPLKGVEFEVWNETDGRSTAKKLRTGDTGWTDIMDHLKPGVWKYEETAFPVGYARSAESSGSFTVANDYTINGDLEYTVTVVNRPISLTFYKVDANGRRPLAGAKIRLRGLTTEYDSTVTTGTDGTASFTFVPVGDYEATEVEAPKGYTKSIDKIKLTVNQDGTVVVTEGDTSFTFVDTEIKIRLLKLDAVTNLPIEGVKFLIDGNEYITDENGIVELPHDLDYGTHTIQEAERKDGYLLDDTPHYFTIDESGAVTAGRNSSGRNPDEADLSETLVVETSEDSTLITLKLTNMPWEKGKLVVYKEDPSGMRLEGAEFTLYKLIDGVPEETGVVLTTSAETPGVYTIDDLDLGSYRVVETKAPIIGGIQYVGHLSEDFVITAEESGKVVTYTAENKPNNPYILKVNEDGEPIADVEFNFWKDGFEDSPDTYVTNADGRIELGPKSEGTWYYEETFVPSPYVLPYDEASRKGSFVVNSNGTIGADEVLDFEIKIKNLHERYADVVVNKKDVNGHPLDGCEFMLQEWSESENAYLGDPDGENQTMMLSRTAAGTYVSDVVKTTFENKGKFRLVETKAPEGYAPDLVREFVIEPEGEMTQHFTVDYEDPYNDLKIKKVAEGTDDVLAGVAFKIDRYAYAEPTGDLAEPQDLLSGDILETYTGTTNASGYIEGSNLQNLPAGVYVIQETATVAGYALNRDEYFVIINEDGFIYELSNFDDSDLWSRGHFELKVENPPNGIRIYKCDIPGNPLAGAQFKIWYDAAGEASAETLTTDATGYAVKDRLQPGAWSVKETVPPAGQSVPAGGYPTYHFTVSEEGYISDGLDERADIVYTLSVRNGDDYAGSLKIEKVDSEKPDRFLSGAKFKIYELDVDTHAWSDCTNKYLGSEFIPEISRGVYYTGADKLQFTVKNNGQFKVVEEKAPAGYIWNKAAKKERGYEVHWEWLFNICTLKDVEFVGESAVPNDMVGMPLKKIDADTGETLNGVVFKVWNSIDGENNAIEVVTGYDVDGNPGDDGVAVIPELKPGATYHVKEIEIRGDLEGKYFVDPRTRIFTVSEEGDISNLTFENGDDGTITMNADDMFEIKNDKISRLIEVRIDKQDEADASVKIGPDDQFNNVAKRQCLFQAFEWNAEAGKYSETPYQMIYNSSVYDTDANGVTTDFHWDDTAKKYVSGMLKITESNQGKFLIKEIHARKGYVGYWTKEIQESSDGETLHVNEQVATNKKQEIFTTAQDKQTFTQVGTDKANGGFIDTVTYKNFEEGKTYHIVGKLYDKYAHEFLKGPNGEITADATITIGETTKPDGGVYGIDDVIKIEFNFDASALEGRKVVIYEYAWDKDESGEDEDIIAQHEDPNDNGQTIFFPFRMWLMTGGRGNMIYYGAALLVGLIAVWFIWKRRKYRLS